MGHNKWMVAYLGLLVACAIPGGLGVMWGVLALIICAGGCFTRWLVEEDKFQQAQREKDLEFLKKSLDKSKDL